VNGRIVRADRIATPARSATFLLGRGLFETMRVVSGDVPLLDLHLDRLRAACREVGLRLPPRKIDRAIAALLERARLRHGVARLTVGEGVGTIMLSPLPAGLARERRDGLRLPVERLIWSPVHLKHTSRLPISLAEDRAGGEVVRLGERERLMETTRSNLFVVTREGAIETAPVPAVLPGVARRLVVEDLRRLGLGVRHRAPRLPENRRWREVFVSNAVRGLRPVVELGGVALPRPVPNGVLRELQRNLDRRMGVRSPSARST
jgi:branched-subunit amino acid aminotransferase/4-amino-4-deoxychorismate lyase